MDKHNEGKVWPALQILIGDDDPTSRKVLRAALEKLGYEVATAVDGEQAWAILQRPDAPKLVILDWLMPGLTGPDICRRLRARKGGHYVYVILLTALNELSALVEGFEAGADDFISKPFRSPELYARLRAGQRVLDLQRVLLAGRAEIERLATRDFLTGLWNRGAIIERLNRELARARRESCPLGVILADIDHFKRINDSYGHSAGDAVLQKTAERLIETVRPYDFVGRYGGEEFLILVNQRNLMDTVSIAKRLCRAIAATPIGVAGTSTTVTASFGVAGTDSLGVTDHGALIDAADRALYRAKNLGRNRVEWSEFDGTRDHSHQDIMRMDRP